ncbi:hypothetical protein [uncultured Campylobacter sp.]|uniref:hypothetical protein n=1 Tax=uncultured Campylobacter sp. TaxID=218934 RepID=UPI0026183877|nr:hypothetical protein [uncultured Campylobacter sp.]
MYSKNRRKSGAKSRQDRRKILYEAGKRKEREFFAKFTTKFHRQKLVQSPPKECPKIKKPPPKNPRDEIPPANFSG